MTLGRLRRRARLIGCRGLRVLASQYLTLVSLAVIATLAVVALRSDAFEDSGRRASDRYAALLRGMPEGIDIGRQQVQSLVWSPPGVDLGPRYVMYYIYETESQRELIDLAMGRLANQRFKLDEGGPEPTLLFLRAATAEEAAAVAKQLRLAKEEAEALGYRFEVLDLRREAGEEGQAP